MGDFCLGVGIEYHEGVFNAPVGCVSNMRNASQSVELDIVLAGVTPQFFERVATQLAGMRKIRFEIGDGTARSRQ